MYRKHLVHRYLIAIEGNQNVCTMKVSINDAVVMSTMACNEVKISTISNFFKETCFFFLKPVPEEIAVNDVQCEEQGGNPAWEMACGY